MDKIKLEKKQIIALSVTAAAVLLLGAAYGTGVYYYSSHFGFRTSINGKDVSGMTAEAAEKTVEDISGKKITVYERDDVSEEIELADIDYEIDVSAADIQNILQSQNAFRWPLTLFQNTALTMTPDISYDTEKLDEAVRGLYALSGEDLQEPQNAYIDLVDGVYEIVPEEQGNTAEEEDVLQAVHDMLADERFEISLEEADCYRKPEITADDETLNTQLSLLADIGNIRITVDLTGAQEDLMGSELADLLVRAEDGTVTADDAKVTAYVSSLKEKYNTIYTAREFTAHDGSVISVGGSGTDTYGWMMNEPSTKQAILDAINSRTSQTVSAYWDVSAWTRDDVNGDIGSTYIEISIGSQHLWFYKNGELVYETDVITGLPSHGQDTPTGVFRIWAKKRNAVLKGTAWDGSTWNSPVAFWMPITWTGVGLHDADWQSAFGGKLYLTRGSHGCVNLSYSAAQYIFNNADLNTPVIVH